MSWEKASNEWRELGLILFSPTPPTPFVLAIQMDRQAERHSKLPTRRLPVHNAGTSSTGKTETEASGPCFVPSCKVCSCLQSFPLPTVSSLVAKAVIFLLKIPKPNNTLTRRPSLWVSYWNGLHFMDRNMPVCRHTYLHPHYPPDGVMLYVLGIKTRVEVHHWFKCPKHAVDPDQQQFELSIRGTVNETFFQESQALPGSQLLTWGKSKTLKPSVRKHQAAEPLLGQQLRGAGAMPQRRGKYHSFDL